MLESYSRRIRDAARHGLVLAAVLGFAGCGAKDDGPKYPDLNSFCNARGNAECSSEVIKACAVSEAARCIAKRQAACVDSMPSGTSYNATGAEACVNAVSASFSDAKLSAQENRTNGDACAGVFDGAGAANATCEKDIDCKVSTGLRCVLRGGSATGTCQVPERVMGGGVCSKPSQSCIPGFHCGASDHCDVNSQVGEPCTDALPCVETARCSAGKCEKKFDDGSPCASDAECTNALCARGTGSTQGICASQMTLAPNEPFCVDAR
jgi:hypothetical protein